jgi:hypothetical protein
LLLSGLTLLAFAGAPALAEAEVCDAACVNYSEHGDIPGDGIKHPNSEGGRGHEPTPQKPGHGAEEAEFPGPETGHEDEGKQAVGAFGGRGPGGPGSVGSPGRPERTPDSRSVLDVGPAKPLPQVGVVRPRPQLGGSGSSPLLPVLIVVAVLAVLSFGAVIYRHRRDLPAS